MDPSDSQVIYVLYFLYPAGLEKVLVQFTVVQYDNTRSKKADLFLMAY